MDKLEIYNTREKKSFEIDLKPDNSISLQMKSNLFSPLDKITLNHSFSISAPDTLRNRRVFGIANDTAIDSEEVRIKFPCKFYRNGVPLFSGTCYVQSIESGAFSLLLTWGLTSMEELKDGGDLEDLDLGNMTFEAAGENGNLPVPNYNTYAECMEYVMFFAHSNGDFAAKNEYNLSATNQFTPCIAARTIFKKCLESAGISYEVDEDAFEFMKRLAIPLPTLDSGKLQIKVDGLGVKGDQDKKIGNTSFYDGAFYFTGFSVDVSNIEVIDGSRFSINSDCDIKLSYSVSFGAGELLGLSRIRLCVVEYDAEGNETSREYKPAESTRMKLNINGGLTYYMEDVELDISGKGEFYFIILGSSSEFVNLSVDKLLAEFNDPPITAGTELSIAANLPKMSKLNYVKALCQICGIFPIPPVDGSNVVRFVTPGVLDANKSKAVDWSGYVNGIPKKINFAFSDFAQSNLITYKDGENHAAAFPMESPTADNKKTAIELPFLHLEGGRWPLWSVEYDEDKKVYEWNRESVDPAIYCLHPFGDNQETDAYLGFDEITPQMILKRWQPLADAVKRAKVIQVELLLPQLDLKYIIGVR